jgi:hypothetical protein
MPLRRSIQSNNRVQANSADGAYCAIPQHGEFVTVAGQFALNDVIEVIPFPAGTIIHSLRAHLQDLDSGTTVTLDFGILSGAYLDADTPARTCGTEFAAASTVGQAGGVIDVAPNLFLGLAPSMIDRAIGFRVAAAPTTLIANARIRVSAIFVPAPQGVAFA